MALCRRDEQGGMRAGADLGGAGGAVLRALELRQKLAAVARVRLEQRVDQRGARSFLLAVRGRLADGLQRGMGGGGRQGLWGHEGLGGGVPHLLGGVSKEANLRAAGQASGACTRSMMHASQCGD